jgi:hypothetical protein
VAHVQLQERAHLLTEIQKVQENPADHLANAMMIHPEAKGPMVHPAEDRASRHSKNLTETVQAKAVEVLSANQLAPVGHEAKAVIQDQEEVHRHSINLTAHLSEKNHPLRNSIQKDQVTEEVEATNVLVAMEEKTKVQDRDGVHPIGLKVHPSAHGNLHSKNLIQKDQVNAEAEVIIKDPIVIMVKTVETKRDQDREEHQVDQKAHPLDQENHRLKNLIQKDQIAKVEAKDLIETKKAAIAREDQDEALPLINRKVRHSAQENHRLRNLIQKDQNAKVEVRDSIGTKKAAIAKEDQEEVLLLINRKVHRSAHVNHHSKNPMMVEKRDHREASLERAEDPVMMLKRVHLETEDEPQVKIPGSLLRREMKDSRKDQGRVFQVAETKKRQMKAYQRVIRFD